MNQSSIFPEFDRPLGLKRPTRSRAASRPGTKVLQTTSQCTGCPRERARKVPPIIPSNARIICVGMAPGAEEEGADDPQPFIGPAGQLLRDALTEAGFDLDCVGFANLGRCRPADDDFESREWGMAERRCFRYLEADLAGSSCPLVLLGNRPVQKFMGDAKQRVTRMRGIWIQTQSGRRAFVMRHPSGVLRAKEDRKKLEQQFRGDAKRLAEALAGQRARDYRVHVYRSPFEAKKFLVWLAKHPGPWACDIETYDAGAFPSRKDVAVDPFHPDFRVRGIAFAWSSKEGAWVDLLEAEARKAEARALLAPVFASEAEKDWFNGNFDENGLIYSGWVPEIYRREGDGMLELIALGDNTHESLSLEKATADILDIAQAWDGFDKSTIRDTPIDVLAKAAVGDACHTFALCRRLHERLEQGDYL